MSDSDRQIEEITEIRILDYFWILYRNKWGVIAIFIFCVIAAFIVTDLTPPVYQSETTIRILESQTPSSLLSGLTLTGLLKGPSLGTYSMLLQSRDLIIAPTVNELIAEGLIEPQPVYNGKWLKPLGGLVNNNLDSSKTEQGDLTDEEWRDLYVKTLIDEKIKIDESQDGNVITLTVNQMKPEYSQLLCNRISATLINVVETEKAENTQWWEKPLTIQMLNEAEEKLKTSEKELFDFQLSNPELTLNAEGGTQAQIIISLQLSENEVTSQLIGAELQYTAFKNELEDIDEQLISSTISRNPTYSQLKEDLNNYEIERKSLIGKYGNVSHPEITALDEKIGETERRLEQEEKDLTSTTSTYNPLHQIISQKISETEAAITSLKEQKKEISEKLTATIRQFGEWSTEQMELFRKKRDVELYNAQVVTLTSKISESKLIDEASPDSLKVLDQARLPQEPIKPRMKLNLVLGAFLGGLLGLTYAVGKNYIQDTYLRLEDSVRQLDSLPDPPSFLGVIPSIKKSSTYRIPLICHDSPSSRSADAFRVIIAKLPFLNPGNGLKTVLITSSTRGEGKSTVSSNLAATFAQSGKKVLLIDGDMRRPSQHTYFEPEVISRIISTDGTTLSDDPDNSQSVVHSDGRKPGLSEALISIKDDNHYDVFNSIVRETDIPNLYLIPGGTVPPNPIELLNSEMMTQLLDIAKAEYDLIVIDSPPVRAVADPIILATVSDAVVYLFDITKTKKFDVLTGIKHLKEVLPEKGIGVLCNMINPKHAKSYGYYNRHSGYYELSE
ncbi:AAA family ATPase [Candidatus Poribacteria bacterium]|nr:AAA family ATPase [Candidatus Poribacteria bacterium]